MAACYITGIAPTEEVEKLETMLGGVSGIDHAKLSVITLAEPTDQHESSFLNFLHPGGGYIDSDATGSLAGADAMIMNSSGGTGVPGIGTPTNRLGYLGSLHIEHRLGPLPIPEDEADNYNDALEDGRCVIAYDCTGIDVTPVESAFRDAGVHRVKTFTD